MLDLVGDFHMRQNILAVLILALPALCFAQTGRYGSGSTYGNILHPGTPSVNPQATGYRAGGSGGRYGGHPTHSPNTIVTYPVYVGGGYYYGGGGYSGDPSQQQYQQQDAPPPLNSYGAPSVVINQTFIPDHPMPVVREYGDGTDSGGQDQSGMRVYEGPRPPVPAAKDDVPTLYLIAMKDHTIVQALGYWQENGSFHYVSAEHTVNQVSMDLIDRDLTQRLNYERNVEFKFPKS
jgi:hypothetical protein